MAVISDLMAAAASEGSDQQSQISDLSTQISDLSSQISDLSSQISDLSFQFSNLSSHLRSQILDLVSDLGSASVLSSQF